MQPLALCDFNIDCPVSFVVNHLLQSTFQKLVPYLVEICYFKICSFSYGPISLKVLDWSVDFSNCLLQVVDGVLLANGKTLKYRINGM